MHKMSKTSKYAKYAQNTKIWIKYALKVFMHILQALVIISKDCKSENLYKVLVVPALSVGVCFSGDLGIFDNMALF